jgi:hypothetical protein
MEGQLLDIPGLQTLVALSFCAQNMHWAWLCLPLRRLHLEGDVRIHMPTWKQPLTRDGASLDKCPTLNSLSMTCWASIFAPDKSYYNFLQETLARCENVYCLSFQVAKGRQEGWLGHSRQGSVDVLLGLIAGTSSILLHLQLMPQDWDQSFYHFVRPLARLDHFVNLITLDIPQDALLGADYGISSRTPASRQMNQLLPASLVKLSIHHAKLTVMRWMGDVLDSRHDLPSFRQIELICYQFGRDTYERFVFTDTCTLSGIN